MRVRIFRTTKSDVTESKGKSCVCCLRIQADDNEVHFTSAIEVWLGKKGSRYKDNGIA